MNLWWVTIVTYSDYMGSSYGLNKFLWWRGAISIDHTKKSHALGYNWHDWIPRPVHNVRLPGIPKSISAMDRQHGWSVVTALVPCEQRYKICRVRPAQCSTPHNWRKICRWKELSGCDIQRQFIHVVPNSSIASKSKPFLEGPTQWSERVAKLKQSVQLAKSFSAERNQLDIPRRFSAVLSPFGKNDAWTEFHRWPVNLVSQLPSLLAGLCLSRSISIFLRSSRLDMDVMVQKIHTKGHISFNDASHHVTNFNTRVPQQSYAALLSHPFLWFGFFDLSNTYYRNCRLSHHLCWALARGILAIHVDERLENWDPTGDTVSSERCKRVFFLENLSWRLKTSIFGIENSKHWRLVWSCLSSPCYLNRLWKSCASIIFQTVSRCCFNAPWLGLAHSIRKWREHGSLLVLTMAAKS